MDMTSILWTRSSLATKPCFLYGFHLLFFKIPNGGKQPKPSPTPNQFLASTCIHGGILDNEASDEQQCQPGR